MTNHDQIVIGYRCGSLRKLNLLVIEHFGETFQPASFREATASARRAPDHQQPVSRLPEESYSCTHQQVGRASQPILGWRPHQVLVVQDTVPIVEPERFPYRSAHRSGSVTFSLEEHDCGRTEAGSVRTTYQW